MADWWEASGSRDETLTGLCSSIRFIFNKHQDNGRRDSLGVMEEVEEDEERFTINRRGWYVQYITGGVKNKSMGLSSTPTCGKKRAQLIYTTREKTRTSTDTFTFRRSQST